MESKRRISCTRQERWKSTENVLEVEILSVLNTGTNLFIDVVDYLQYRPIYILISYKVHLAHELSRKANMSSNNWNMEIVSGKTHINSLPDSVHSVRHHSHMISTKQNLNSSRGMSCKVFFVDKLHAGFSCWNGTARITTVLYNVEIF